MSRSRRPQNARENRKQNLLTPTGAMCILIGRRRRCISLQGCGRFRHHADPSSHHTGSCTDNINMYSTVFTFIPFLSLVNVCCFEETV